MLHVYRDKRHKLALTGLIHASSFDDLPEVIEPANPFASHSPSPSRGWGLDPLQIHY